MKTYIAPHSTVINLQTSHHLLLGSIVENTSDAGEQDNVEFESLSRGWDSANWNDAELKPFLF